MTTFTPRARNLKIACQEVFEVVPQRLSSRAFVPPARFGASPILRRICQGHLPLVKGRLATQLVRLDLPKARNLTRGQGQVSEPPQIRNDRSRLVQQRFPICRNSSCRSWCWLILRMRMRRKQLHALDHTRLIVIEEPILTRLETRNYRCPVAAACLDAC
jgi:hypothetical protein